jgi:hypothetical protein
LCACPVPGDLAVRGPTDAGPRAVEGAADYDRARELEAAGGLGIDLPAADWRALTA